MTFLSEAASSNSRLRLFVHATYCLFALLCAAYEIKSSPWLSQSTLRSGSALWVQYLLLVLCFSLAVENAAFSVVYGEIHIPVWLTAVVYSIQAVTVPVLLITIFEAGYLVHKRRSVKFCFISFDEGQRVGRSGLYSNLLRNWIRLLGFCLFALGIAVNFEVLARRNDGPWAHGFQSMWRHDLSLSSGLTLIPPAVFSFFSLYVSLQMWRFGTSSSLVVHATCCNGWAVLFIGSLVHCASLFSPGAWFALCSNGGDLIVLLALIYTFNEINRDLQAQADFKQFLECHHKAPPSVLSTTEIQNRKPRVTEPRSQIL